MTRTIADGLAQRQDNFLLLRIVAAAMVIWKIVIPMRTWIPLHGALLIAAIVVAVLLRNTGLYAAAFAVCEVLFVFWFAYGIPWTGFNRFGDYIIANPGGFAATLAVPRSCASANPVRLHEKHPALPCRSEPWSILW